jgi:hypothetical protein
MCSLSPNTFLVLGERASVRGQHLADSRNSRFVAEGLTTTTKRETCHSATSGPLSLPSLARGYLLTPFQGFQDEAAASLPLDFIIVSNL